MGTFTVFTWEAFGFHFSVNCKDTMSKSCVFLSMENLELDRGPPHSPVLRQRAHARASPKSLFAAARPYGASVPSRTIHLFTHF